MRGLMTALLLLVLIAMVPPAASAQTATTSAPVAGAQEPAAGSNWFGTPASGTEDVMRSMYVSMGAMAGYMFAVMPLTTAAVTAAVASGLASMWAYDYLLAPSSAPAAYAH